MEESVIELDRDIAVKPVVETACIEAVCIHSRDANRKTLVARFIDGFITYIGVRIAHGAIM